MVSFTHTIVTSFCVALLLAAQSFAQSPPDSSETQIALAKSREAAKTHLSTVRSLLMQELGKGGALRAINVCADSAQIVGEHVEEKLGLSIRRVSEKWRNPKDKPDKYESEQLKMLERLHAKKNLSDTLEVYGLVTEGSVRTFRYLRPIFVSEMCLNCHGGRDKMKDLIYSAVRSRYPNDKAVDYNAGDLRGAVSVKIAIK